MTEPSEHHQLLRVWALDNGVTLKKVRPAYFEGAGVGMVATEKISKNEKITFVPTKLLLNILPVVPKPTTAHGDLAAKLLEIKYEPGHDESKKWDSWVNILPESGFEKALPMFWDNKWWRYLNEGCSDLVHSQNAKFERDLMRTNQSQTKKSKQEWTRDQYQWAWAIVNSRTLHYLPRSWKKARTIPEDCMTMCPIVDYYNHTGDANTSFSDDGFSVKTQKSYSSKPPIIPSTLSSLCYQAGEEIFVTYGGHCNDHLLCEYGFTLPNNLHDYTLITTHIMRLLSDRHKQTLNEHGFLGDYRLNPSGVCYRSQIAIKLSLIPEIELNSRSKTFRIWIRVVKDGYEDSEGDEVVREKGREIVQRVIKEAKDKLEELSQIQDTATKVKILKERWEAVVQMGRGVVDDSDEEVE